MSDQIMISGFDFNGERIRHAFTNPILTVLAHKAATRGHLVDGSAVLLNWLDKNSVVADPRLGFEWEVCGYDNDDLELWEDRGQRAFCKMFLSAISPAVCGFALKVPESGSSLMDYPLLMLATIAHGLDLGMRLPGNPEKRILQNIEPLVVKTMDVLAEAIPVVNKRAELFLQGATPTSFKAFTAFIRESGQLRPVYPSRQMAENSKLIANSISGDLAARATRKGEIEIIATFPDVGTVDD
jgi:hypothetical protein